VQEAAERLAEAARHLKKGETLVAGGEPTVVHKGKGKGGRCMELAARFALQHVPGIEALFGSSDGVDGNSGAAGAILPPLPNQIDRHRIESELAASNSFVVVEMLGRAIMIPPTGNNLRDLVLLARA
jgi:glycerate-2-kinase